LELDRIHQLLVYANGVNTLDENINTIKKKTKAQVEDGKEVRLSLTAKKTKFIFISPHRNAVQNCNKTIVNK
jgi:hypothetical protein